MKDKIDNIISKIFSIKLEEISNDLTADEIDGWDSLSHMELIAEIEKNYKIKFTTKEMFNFFSIADLKKILKKKIK